MNPKPGVSLILACLFTLFILNSFACAAAPHNLKLSGTIVGGVSRDVVIQGNYAYVGVMPGGVAIIDITLASTPSSELRKQFIFCKK